MKRYQSVCVFCGSSVGSSPAYGEAARTLGHYLGENGITLVYGGGHRGLMGMVADAALEKNGYVVGIIPESMSIREIQHQGLPELHVVKSMHERKAMMNARSEAFIALPGGFGTFEELFEVITWAQLGIHNKPIALWNVEGYFDPLLAMSRHALEQGFIREIDPQLLLIGTTLEEVAEKMEAYQPSAFRPKWMSSHQI